MATIKPLEDRIVVQIVEAEQTTASGLVIPDTAKEKPQEAKVIAVGPGRVDDKGNRIPVDVAEGDLCLSFYNLLLLVTRPCEKFMVFTKDP